MMVNQLISEIEPKEIIKGYKGRFVHTENMTIAFWEVEAGAEIPLHNHIHEQVSQIIDGEFDLTDKNAILISSEIAERLDVSAGDRLKVLTTKRFTE